jgi:hypothetical protein
VVNEKLKVSKLEAAKRQLREAIILFFEERDPVSIHTLTAAARGILLDLSRKLTVPVTSSRTFTSRMPKEFRKKYYEFVNKPQNYFKHADRNHAETIEFEKKLTIYLLMEAILIYFQLTGKFFLEADGFRVWFATNHKGFLSGELEKMGINEAEEIIINDFETVREYFKSQFARKRRMQEGPAELKREEGD